MFGCAHQTHVHYALCINVVVSVSLNRLHRTQHPVTLNTHIQFVARNQQNMNARLDRLASPVSYRTIVNTHPKQNPDTNIDYVQCQDTNHFAEQHRSPCNVFSPWNRAHWFRQTVQTEQNSNIILTPRPPLLSPPPSCVVLCVWKPTTRHNHDNFSRSANSCIHPEEDVWRRGGRA